MKTVPHGVSVRSETDQLARWDPNQKQLLCLATAKSLWRPSLFRPEVILGENGMKTKYRGHCGIVRALMHATQSGCLAVPFYPADAMEHPPLDHYVAPPEGVRGRTYSDLSETSLAETRFVTY